MRIRASIFPRRRYPIAAVGSGRPFDKGTRRSIPHAVQTGCELALGLERNICEFRQRPDGFHFDDLGLVCHAQQCHVDRVAVMDPAVIAMTEEGVIR